MEKKEIGNKGESFAISYLQKKGYTIREKNWYFRHREIDIIAEKENSLTFIEVKTRSYPFLHNPLFAVNKQKQNFIISAADNYIKRKQLNKEACFDIIIVTLQHEEHSIEHIEDAYSIIG